MPDPWMPIAIGETDPDYQEAPEILFIQSPEGAVLCNECHVYIDDAYHPEGHARDCHGGTVLQVVHPDDE